MLIASLPPVHQDGLMREMISHPLVSMVRYNTGMDSAYSAEETLRKILDQALPYKKPLWVDLKGRQLRVVEWATLPYGPITLNHPIKVEFPAKVFFRGDDWCNLKEVVDGTKIYVDPLPRFPVGRGQAVNIVAKKLEIEGYLTQNDRAYIRAAVKEGVLNFMLSFVEDFEYIRVLERELNGLSKENKFGRGYELVLKIESAGGIEFIRGTERIHFGRYQLMAARDDLMLQIGGLAMIDALKSIINKDPDAICASRLMMGLEQAGSITMADISDIRLMQAMGYKNFMLSDGISRNHFRKAVEFWEEYIARYPKSKPAA